MQQEFSMDWINHGKTFVDSLGLKFDFKMGLKYMEESK